MRAGKKLTKYWFFEQDFTVIIQKPRSILVLQTQNIITRFKECITLCLVLTSTLFLRQKKL